MAGWVTWFLSILALLLLAAAAWLAWRLFRLKNRLRKYTRQVRNSSGEESVSSTLPEDFPSLEQLSNNVREMAGELEARLADVIIEKDKLALVLERMTDGVLIADSNGQVLFANPAAEQLFDIRAAAGRTVTEVVRQHQFVEAWQRCRDTGKPQEESLEVPARRLFLRLVVLPEISTGGCLLMVQDLTRVRRLETIRRDFISNISHELRTPLASLKALTETLRDGALEKPDAARRFLGHMETEVDALAQMAQELLELTRIESGQVPLEMKPVNPGQLVQSAADRMRMQAERAGLILGINLPVELPMLSADPTRLEQVLVNLIHNAIKFTPPGGSVEVSASLNESKVRFTVKDTGVGIPIDDLERIFERFYKADQARSGGGTGLGLSIARHIVDAHRGRIWVESMEGRGSSFHFTIPV
jgi:two-component system phosphate regulon sensor histidine kinase PhoR